MRNTILVHGKRCSRRCTAIADEYTELTSILYVEAVQWGLTQIGVVSEASS